MIDRVRRIIGMGRWPRRARASASFAERLSRALHGRDDMVLHLSSLELASREDAALDAAERLRWRERGA